MTTLIAVARECGSRVLKGASVVLPYPPGKQNPEGRSVGSIVVGDTGLEPVTFCV